MIAPGNFREVLAGTRVAGASTMPPALYIHMPHDAGGWVGWDARETCALLLRHVSWPAYLQDALPRPAQPSRPVCASC